MEKPPDRFANFDEFRQVAVIPRVLTMPKLPVQWASHAAVAREQPGDFLMRRPGYNAAMRDSERLKLRFGAYRTPRFRYGAVVEDAIRGDVGIVGLSDARIPWPKGRRLGSQDTNRGLVVYGALLKALRLEANQAVAYWWGVTGQTVTVWRNALGIIGPTPGDTAVRRAHFHEPWADAMRKKAWSKARDPGRREKIAAARRGKPRPAQVVEGMRKRMLGTKLPASTRQKMSEAHNRRGTRPPKAGRPWTAREDALLRRLPAAEVAKRTGRTLKAVYFRRQQLGVRSKRGQAPNAGRAAMSDSDTAILPRRSGAV